MEPLVINMLGDLSVWQQGQRKTLPASKKTRALLAYLVLVNRPQRRDRLCDLLWEIPDDPRGALRWSLSKIRPLVNENNSQRLASDRERVQFIRDDTTVDLVAIQTTLQTEDLKHSQLKNILKQLSEPLLQGIDLPNQPEFQAWLTAEREELNHTRAEVAARLAQHPETSLPAALNFGRLWLELDPYNSHAGAFVLEKLSNLDKTSEHHDLSVQLSRRFENAGVEWPVKNPTSVKASLSTADQSTTTKPRVSFPDRRKRDLLARQRIQFCTAADDVRIAYATIGKGKPIVKAANWLNHLELDWDAPIWSPLFRELARDNKFIRYDERGNGLSDWDVPEITFETFVTDLETVIDSLDLENFPLLGISQGASVSIEYAVRHPERVSHLILFGGYTAGWRIDASEDEVKEREAIMTLTATGWGKDNPAYRQIFTSTFMPTATQEELNWFNEFQRQTTSPENAVRFLSAFGDIDVRHRLAELDVPTLVIHSRGDKRIPFSTGREIAAQIKHAEFLGLESENHLLLGREAASVEFVSAVREFIQ